MELVIGFLSKTFEIKGKRWAELTSLRILNLRSTLKLCHEIESRFIITPKMEIILWQEFV